MVRWRELGSQSKIGSYGSETVAATKLKKINYYTPVNGRSSGHLAGWSPSRRRLAEEQTYQRRQYKSHIHEYTVIHL